MNQQKKEKTQEQVLSHRFIEEFSDDDKYNELGDEAKAKPANILDEDLARKKQFLSSKDPQNFGQVLAITQIRSDYSNNDDPFVKHLFNVEKALRKGIRDILIKQGKIQNKEEFKVVYQYIYISSKQMRLNIVRVFYEDINTGFITSTGQIKSTAFVYIHKGLLDVFNRQKINLQFQKTAIKMTLTFFSTSSLTLIQTAQSLLLDVKSAFIRTNKFYNEFLVLSQTAQDQLRSGVSVFFVYRPIDDQIYAVKRSKLQSSQINFFDIFSTGSMNELTPDQRKIREAKILSKLNHPSILKLYDWWIEQANDIYYLYMQLEYVSYPGFKYQTTDLLTFSYFYLNPKSNQEKLAVIKHMMMQLLDGLEYIHKRGIVHRDLKPENIFITRSVSGELQVILADFDQGKDVREQKLSIITDERLEKEELNSVKSQNTINAGTQGYQTPNYNMYGNYDESDEFYAIGVTLLHLVLTFPGEPKNRNHYAQTFTMCENEEVFPLLDSWAQKFVKNRNEDFKFAYFNPVLNLAKQLLCKSIKDHAEIKRCLEKF